MKHIKDQVAPKKRFSEQKSNNINAVCSRYAAKQLMSAEQLLVLATQSYGGAV
ncbi:hypothetical protein J8L98_02115 [Pseudoalteromonas sp. MMG013]|uniref:hypothetical protein n=1 Tax=Pseudoalteromonas sp. MMG013 TaxID=2822687 RepID=UPI001B3858B0|nr:hypothetical protein [Pseudoalteromonas sp. MMG013]MBQ4860487.1 hypothetical protein [Pseudoalteromonas sp. MMG013]